MIRYKLIAVIAVLLLNGCATSEALYKRKDGADVYAAQCSGTQHAWSSCYKEAARVCEGDFIVMEKSEQKAPGVLMPTVIGLHAIQGVNRELIFTCGG